MLDETKRDADFVEAAPGWAYAITATDLDKVGGDIRKIKWPSCPHMVVWDSRTENALVVRIREGGDPWVKGLAALAFA